MSEETTKPSSIPNLKRAFKKSVGVFKTEFAVPAAFCTFLVLVLVVETILYNVPSLYRFYWFSKINVIGWLTISAIIGILASMLCAFYTKKKFVQVICGVAGMGISILLLIWEDRFFRSSDKYLGFFVTLVFLIMHKFYSGEKKGESLLFAVAKFFNPIALCFPFFLLAVVIESCSEYSKVHWLAEMAFAFFMIAIFVIIMFYFLSHVHTDSANNLGISEVEEGLSYAAPMGIFIICALFQYLFLLEDIFLHKFWNNTDIRYCILFASVYYIYVYSITKSYGGKGSKIFCKVGRIALLPLIVVQLVLLHKPYSTYGLTGSRICILSYFVAVFVFIVISFFKNEKCTEKVYLVAAIVVFLLVVQPFDAQRMGVYCQKAHLENYLIKKGIFDKKTLTIAEDWKALNLSKEDELVIESSYMYLNCKSFDYKNAIPDFCEQKNFSKNLFRID